MRLVQNPKSDARAMQRGHPNAQRTVPTEQEQFLYTVTHDMKAGLRALSELPTWVEEDLKDHQIDLPAGVKEHLDLMRRNAQDLSTLLDGLITLSRAGQAPDAAVSTTVEQVARRAWVKAMAGPRFHLDTEEAFDTIHLPERATNAVFKAVLENTLHHHDRDTGKVTVTSETSDDRVWITVTDDGPGIPDPARARVFDAFQMLALREETDRTGLGLTIARKIITKLGGTITLDQTSEDRGLSVVFDLPKTAQW